MDRIPQPQVESKFPDCVTMKLHLEVEAGSTAIGFVGAGMATHPTEMNLSLTINFSGEQEIEMPGGKRFGLPEGRARFGIKRGELRFIFEKCSLPLETTALLQPFKVSIPVEQQQTRANEIQAAAALETRSIGAKISRGSSEKVTIDVFQVKKTGADDRPGWIFEAYGDRSILEGALQKTLLGVLSVMECPCELSASFTVRGDDIRLTWGKYGLTNDIHQNKLAVIERAIVVRYLKPLIEAEPICSGRWQHG